MNNLCLLGVGLEISSHTIGKTHTDSNQHVTLLLFLVGSIVAMHTQHTDIQRMITRQGAQAQHRTTGRDIGFLQECLQLLMGITQFYALSDQGQRALCVVDQIGSLSYGFLIECRRGNIRPHEIHFRRIVFNLLYLRILGKVEHHRTWAPTLGNKEGSADSPGDILCTAYLITPLTDRL